MKSQLNFKVIKNGTEYNMHEMGIWVSSFHIHSPNAIRNKVIVPGMPGAHLASTDEGERSVYIAMQIEADSISDYDELKHKIFDLFYSKNYVTIIRDLYPDRKIKVLQEGSYDINNITTEDGEFDLLLTMTDPYIYGPEKQFQFPSDVFTLTNNGTAEADPVFELKVLQPITFAMIQNHLEQYMMIGRPIDIESQTPYARYQNVFSDDANTLSGWDPAANGEIDGVISGTMETVNDRFQALSYGEGSAWHGPAIKKSLTEVTQDFRLNTWITLDNSGNSVGRIELYLLDASGQIVAKIAMKDPTARATLAYGEIRIGKALDGHDLIHEYGDKKGNWNNFAGLLNIQREGNYWSASIMMGTAATGYHTRRFAHWYDTENKHMNPIAQVVVHMGQYGTMNPVAGGVYSINIDKINPEPVGGVPYIADVGDVIQFNHEEKMIYINGEPQMDLKDFGASFFQLAKGENPLLVHPSNAIHTTARYKERHR